MTLRYSEYVGSCITPVEGSLCTIISLLLPPSSGRLARVMVRFWPHVRRLWRSYPHGSRNTLLGLVLGFLAHCLKLHLQLNLSQLVFDVPDGLVLVFDFDWSSALPRLLHRLAVGLASLRCRCLVAV